MWHTQSQRMLSDQQLMRDLVRNMSVYKDKHIFVAVMSLNKPIDAEKIKKK